jgi:hypothetical protein
MFENPPKEVDTDPMSRLADIRAQSRLSDILEGQPQHLGFAILLTVGALSLLRPDPNAIPLLGLTATGWAKLSIALALFHQIMVAVVFRLQLHRNSLTRFFGEKDLKFWTVVFMPFLVARPLTLIMTGWADNTPITGLRGAEILAGLALVAVAIWAMHSVIVHFTIPRAVGGDHFRDTFADMPLVDKGAFAITGNAMYGVVFLGLWGIALLFGSWNALVLAFFQHVYIWVHMYCTEKPDMEWIYGDRRSTS